MRRTRLSPLIAYVVTVLTSLSLLVAPPATAEPTTVTAASGVAKMLVTDGFTAGNIISDSVFFNSASMTAGEIDAFLRGKVHTCQSGYTCLKDYRQSTPDRPADQYCKGYSGASNESAATIIHRVAQSCGINPQVFIVMLQKEQSLVTHTWPSDWRYTKALGQGCPDTAPCDPRYAGFFYQIYGAGRQMKIYTEGRYFTWYAPGKTWNILYNPNRACGSAPVYVENAATAALYYYTPYQPNGAALRAGYGNGDSCSAYGNRNFYNYFKDWFGNPRGYPVSGAIRDAWLANGGERGWIGAATSAPRSWSGGSSQRFVNADIFVRSGHPARVVTGPMRSEYRLVGEVASGLGWPTSNRVVISGGAYQDFTGGRIYERNGRAFAIAAPMFAQHEAVGNVFGPYGWPTSRAYRIPGGATQTFDGGAFFETPSGVAALDRTWTAWLTASGGTGGPYGIPLTGATDAGGQLRVGLSKAVAFRSGAAVRVVSGPHFDAYAAQGYEKGKLARPTSGIISIAGGTTQTFEGGSTYASAAGAYSVSRFAAALKNAGGTSVAGLPVENERSTRSASSQRFSQLTFTSGTSGDHVVRGAIKRLYDSLGGASAELGAAISAERKERDGFVQQFDGGRIVCTPAILAVVPASINAAWVATGGSGGRLGWPVSAAMTIGSATQQSFNGGVVVTGQDGRAYPIFGATLTAFRAAGGTAALGAPLEAEKESVDGYSQRFERGVVFVPRRGVASAVTGATFTEYTRVGGMNVMGSAVGPAAPLGAGTVQPFRTGSIAVYGEDAYTVRGTMARVFQAAGGYAGPLGYPQEAERPLRDGFVQAFQGGTGYVSPVALAVTRGVLHREYMRRGGPEGSLGWPLGNETSGSGVWRQSFESGTIYLYADGRIVVR